MDPLNHKRTVGFRDLVGTGIAPVKTKTAVKLYVQVHAWGVKI